MKKIPTPEIEIWGTKPVLYDSVDFGELASQMFSKIVCHLGDVEVTFVPMAVCFSKCCIIWFSIISNAFWHDLLATPLWPLLRSPPQMDVSN